MSRPRFATVLTANAWVVWTWITAVALVHAVHYGSGLGRPSLGLALSSSAAPALFVAATPTAARRWTACLVVLALAVLAVVNALYFRFFHDYIPLALLRNVGQAWSVRGYGSGLMRASDLVLPTAAIGATAAAAWRPARRPLVLHPRWQMAAPLAWCLLGCVPALGWTWVVAPGSADNNTGGFLYAALVDGRRGLTESIAPKEPPSAEMARVRAFTSAPRPHEGSPDLWLGAAAGSSVLMIQVEALNRWTLDEDLDGKPVLPFLRSLAERGLDFTEIYDGVHEGRSSDADYMVMASQQPLEHGAVSMTRPNLDLAALPNVLAARGYTTFSAHAHNAGFWNSGIRHARYGFQRSAFSPELGTGEEEGEGLGFGLLDKLFMERAEPMITELRTPFLAWLITLTMHGPHGPVPASLRTFDLGGLDGTPLGNYLLKARHTDDAIRELVAALDSAGILAHTTLLVYGDHTDGFLFDTDEVHRIAGVADLPPDEAALRLDRIPLLVVPPAGTVAPARITTPGTLVDVAPTILHLLGVPSPTSFVGRSLLPEGPGLAAQVTGEAVGGDVAWSGSACYARAGWSSRPAGDCDALRANARDQLDVSWTITRYDLSTRLEGAGPP